MPAALPSRPHFLVATAHNVTQIPVAVSADHPRVPCPTLLLGQVSPSVTHHGATALFFFFGLKSVYSSTLGWAGGEDELSEVEAELNEKKTPKKGTKAKTGGKKGTDSGGASPAYSCPFAFLTLCLMLPPPAAAEPARWLDPILVQVFTLTFLAEWGDRSQVATIGLAASANVAGVTAGGCLGHALCTGAAVLGGKGMATMISERAVAVRFVSPRLPNAMHSHLSALHPLTQLSGGVLFILFGVHSLLTGPPLM